VINILTFEERMHFWKSVLIKEQTFRKEETWANALIRSGPPLWLFLSIIFLLYSITGKGVKSAFDPWGKGVKSAFDP